MKAGGLAVLGVKAAGHRTEIKLLITYDNDPHATGSPADSRRRCLSTTGAERDDHRASRSRSGRSAGPVKALNAANYAGELPIKLL